MLHIRSDGPVVERSRGQDHGVLIGPARGVCPGLLLVVPVVGARGEAGDAVGIVAPHGEGEVDLVGGQGDVGVQRQDGVGDDLKWSKSIITKSAYFIRMYVQRSSNRLLR